MGIIAKALPWIEIILSLALIGTILLQQSGSGLGGALGGSDSNNTYHTRRGFEKVLFYLTIILAILFAFFALLRVFI